MLDQVFLRKLFKSDIEKKGDIDESMAKLRNFPTEVFDRLNDLFPEIRLKEYMIGFSVSKCDLLLPTIPMSDDY